tara:strand:+ start:553 stop:744 length:192 start_codon:yes stop_codon:yes gene_type:complete
MKDLQKKREDLENKYNRMITAHTSKGHVANEGSHLDSAKEIKAIYEELYQVALELGDPVPLWV